MPKRSQNLPEEYNEHTKALAQAIGSRIRQRRVALGLSQEILRVRMELHSVYVSRAHFSRIELGESLPNAAQVIALSRVLHVSFSWLLIGSEEEAAPR